MRTDLVVVGAGPAGLAAATAALAEGLTVTVVDERRAAGGSVDGPPGASAADSERAWFMPPLDPTPAALERTAQLRSEAAGAEFLLDALVWGLFPGWVLAVTKGGRTQRLEADQVVIATGAYVPRTPFPGHELTGILTPLGMVRATDDGRLGAGARVAVMGSGELAAAVATTLRSAGITQLFQLSEQPGSAVVEPSYLLAAPPTARGETRLTGLSLELAGGEKVELAADWLVLAGPIAAASELAMMAGCEHRFAGFEAGFLPLHGPDGATSVPGLFVAGAVTGLGAGAGLDLAGTAACEHSGKVAGLAAAVRAGRASAERLSELLRQPAPPAPSGPGLLPLAYRRQPDRPESSICHCVGATYGGVAAAIRDGARTIDDVKRQAKAGMGACQGRDCYRAVVQLLAAVGGIDPATLRPMRGRPPIRPVLAREMFEGEVSS